MKNNSHHDILRKILTSISIFLLAGLFEIGGGYLAWLWLRENMSWILGVTGGIVLFLYGIVPTFQRSYFRRTYAAPMKLQLTYFHNQALKLIRYSSAMFDRLNAHKENEAENILTTSKLYRLSS